MNIIGDFNREILDITSDTSLASAKEVPQLEQLVEWRGKPEKFVLTTALSLLQEN
ncbi:hypothetical protein [Chryseobacterium foetidum]|uniref:hypothetical protein n=1 Tax=Chryseobacterium foetidum TaxID=2951057 RepID=UPI0021C9083C|nr:hypothetical protein [Chryseobacterium foetidum]